MIKSTIAALAATPLLLSGATNVDDVDWGAKAGLKYTF